jgi:hypothetical protein
MERLPLKSLSRVAESPAVGFVCFSVLAVSWLLVAA